MLEKLIKYNFKIAEKLLIDKNNKVNYRVIDQEFKSQNQEQVYAWVTPEHLTKITCLFFTCLFFHLLSARPVIFVFTVH